MKFFKRAACIAMGCAFFCGISATADTMQKNYIETTDAVYTRVMYDTDSTENEPLWVSESENGWDLLKYDGTKINKKPYDYIGEVYHYYDLFIVGNDSKFGCINESGDEVIPLEYDTLYRCGTNRFIFEKNGKFGLMDKNCNVIIKNEFDYLRPVINGEVDESAPDSAKQDSDIFVSGIYCAKLNGKAGIVDAKGEILLPFEYAGIDTYMTNGRIAVFADLFSAGFADEHGKLVIDVREIRSGSDGSMNASFSDGVYTYKNTAIDTNGKELFTTDYDITVFDFSEDLAPCMMPDGGTGLYGYINKKGETVIGLMYENAEEFSEGLACVTLNGKRGYIDKNGKTVIDFKYDDAFSFKNGMAIVRIGEKYGVINKEGNTLIPFDYEELSFTHSGYLSARKNGKAGIIDCMGSTVVAFDYDSVYIAKVIGDVWYAKYECNGKTGFIKSTDKNTVVMHIGDSVMRVNGVESEVDPGRGTAPVISNSRTLVPIRAIIEAFGGDVQWDDASRTVTLNLGKNELEMTIDSKVISLNGKKTEIDVAPVIENGRTLIPIRSLENLGCTVAWNSSGYRVFVAY